MTKQLLSEMKKFMQIAKGTVTEANASPELKKAAKLMKSVADALGREYEDLANAAGDDAEEREFAEYTLADSRDYDKLAKMLLAGRGKKAAEVYDYLDTSAREFIYDHLEQHEIQFLQGVFGKLGSSWLYSDDDEDGANWRTESVEEEDEEQDAPQCSYCNDEEPLDDFPCLNCGSKQFVGEGMNFYRFAVVVSDSPRMKKVEVTEYPERQQKVIAQRLADKTGEHVALEEWTSKRLGPSTSTMVVQQFKPKGGKLGEDLDPDGMGYYSVTVQIEDNYPDEIETAIPYNEAMRAAQDHVNSLKKGQWEVKKYSMQDAVEWQMLTGDEISVTVRVEPTEDADVEAWHGPDFDLDDVVESTLTGDERQLWNIVDDDEMNAAIRGKSQTVKDVADELGIDVEDKGLAKDFDVDDYPEAEDEELGLRFD